MPEPNSTLRSRLAAWRHSLYHRALLFAVLGSGCLVGAVAVQSTALLTGTFDGLLGERAELARSLGRFQERLLLHDAGVVANLARDGRAQQGGAREAALAAVLPALHFDRGLFVLDVRGNLLASAPAQAARWAGVEGFAALVQRGLHQAKPLASRILRASPSGETALVVLVPLRDERGQLSGLAGGAFDPTTTNLLAFAGAVQFGPTSRVELIDGGGTVVASTRPQSLLAASDHDSVLARAIVQRSAIRSRCHSCHEGAAPSREVEVLAFVPLPTLELGVALRQRESEALAPAFALERRVLLLGTTFMPLFLIFVGLSVRSVVRPLVRLTRAVRATETTGAPLELPRFGQDEVGELAHALGRWHAHRLASDAELLREHEQRVLLRRVLSAQEEERRRIARDLHDTVAQDLAALRFEIERLQRQPMSEALAVRLVALEAQAHEMHGTVRRILLDLRPSVLDDLGFLPALQWYLERVERESAVRARLSVEGDEVPLEREMVVTLFRIFQEALNNVVRHAHAEHVLATVTFGAGRVELAVEDDGQGFDPHDNGPHDAGHPHLGLAGMRERVGLLGGELHIDSKPGEGTTIRVVAPVAAAPPPQGA